MAVKSVNKTRLFLWGTVTALIGIGVVLVLFIFNFQILEKAVVTANQAAVEQSKNIRYYVHEYKKAKTDLDVANQQLVELAQELEAASTDLSAARSELSSVQVINDQLKESITSLERYKDKAASKGEALGGMIKVLKKKNKTLDFDLQGLRKELAVFQPDIDDVHEGRSKVLLFKDHIYRVKKNMTALREQAQMIQKEAQKERDRLEALYGNGGYIVKDGQDMSVTKMGSKVVDINVRFVNP